MFGRGDHKVFFPHYKVYKYSWKAITFDDYMKSDIFPKFQRQSSSYNNFILHISRPMKVIKCWSFFQKMRREKFYKTYITQSYWLALMAFCLLNTNSLYDSTSFQKNTNGWKTFLLCEYLDLRKSKYLDFFLKDAPSKAVYKLHDCKTQTPSKQFYPVGK